MEGFGRDFWRKVGMALTASFLGLLILFFWQYFKFYDDKLHLVFCDVGQGDAILIRKNAQEMLIDGGPDQKVLSCLAENMAFWDRKIEVVALSHPQADHLTGLIAVLKRYQVAGFIASPVGNSSAGFKALESLIGQKQVRLKNLYSGSKISFQGLQLFALWPEKSWLIAHLDPSGSAAALAKASAGKAVLGAQTSTNLNDFSYVFHLKYGSFDALLTGDADERVQDKMMEVSEIPEVEVFKVPHHGSETGMIDEYLEAASPELAVVSVGKNRFGHPAKEVIEKLRNEEIKILRTDEDGEVEIVSDGKSWTLRR